MFKNGDKKLIYAMIVIMVFTALSITVSVILGIIWIIKFSIWRGLLIVVIGVVSSFFFYLFWSLYLYFLCDVKLIRNKLYNESNKVFDSWFINEYKQKSNEEKIISVQKNNLNDKKISEKLEEKTHEDDKYWA